MGNGIRELGIEITKAEHKKVFELMEKTEEVRERLEKEIKEAEAQYASLMSTLSRKYNIKEQIREQMTSVGEIPELYGFSFDFRRRTIFAYRANKIVPR